MTHKLSIIIFAALALVAGGCRDWFPPLDPTDPTDPVDPPPLTTEFRNVRWCLESFEEKNAVTPVDPNLDIHVIFDDNNQVSGFGGCNGFGGEYKASNNAELRISDIWSTDMYCDAAGRYENLFFDALIKAESYTVSGDGLHFRISYDNGNILNFRSCGTGDPGDPTDPVDSLNEVKIPYGGTAYIGGELTISFESLLEESRCPKGMACIDAGNAKIAIVATEGTNSERLELNTTKGARSVTFRDYQIELTYLYPDPVANEEIPIHGYMAVLRVTKQ